MKYSWTCRIENRMRRAPRVKHEAGDVAAIPPITPYRTLAETLDLLVWEMRTPRCPSFMRAASSKPHPFVSNWLHMRFITSFALAEKLFDAREGGTIEVLTPHDNSADRHWGGGRVGSTPPTLICRRAATRLGFRVAPHAAMIADASPEAGMTQRGMRRLRRIVARSRTVRLSDSRSPRCSPYRATFRYFRRHGGQIPGRAIPVSRGLNYVLHEARSAWSDR